MLKFGYNQKIFSFMVHTHYCLINNRINSISRIVVFLFYLFAIGKICKSVKMFSSVLRILF